MQGSNGSPHTFLAAFPGTDFTFNDINAAPFNEAACYGAGAVLTNKLQCEEACIKTEGCLGFTFALSSAGAHAGCCWLKNKMTGAGTAQAIVDSYKVIRGG